MGTISWITVYHSDFRRSNTQAACRVVHTRVQEMNGCFWVTRISWASRSAFAYMCRTLYRRSLSILYVSVFPGGVMPCVVHNVRRRLVCSGLISLLGDSLRADLGSKSSVRKLLPILLVSLGATFGLRQASCTSLPHPSAPNFLGLLSLERGNWYAESRTLHVNTVVSCCVCALGVGGSVPRTRSLLVDTFALTVLSGRDIAPLRMRSAPALALL